jgi:hypothetical protein
MVFKTLLCATALAGRAATATEQGVFVGKPTEDDYWNAMLAMFDGGKARDCWQGHHRD